MLNLPSRPVCGFVLTSHELEEAPDRPVIAVAARPALHVDARIDHFPREPKRLDDCGERRTVFACIRVEHVVRAVENRLVGRETMLRHPRGSDAGSRRMARVERFGHRAEVADEAAHLRSGETESRARLLHVELPQPRCDRSARKSPDRRRRMPAPNIVTVAHRAADLAGDLEPEGIGGEDLGTRRADHFGNRQRRRHHRRAGMAAQALQAVVEIERVRAHAVHESGFGGRSR
jgi:hypothetical protein